MKKSLAFPLIFGLASFAGVHSSAAYSDDSSGTYSSAPAGPTTPMSPVPAMVTPQKGTYLEGPRPASDYIQRLRGSGWVGYATMYDYRGMITAHSIATGAVFSVGGDVTTPIGDTGLNIRLDAHYKVITDGILRHKNEVLISPQVEKEVFPNLTAFVGFNYIYGGLPGLVASSHGNSPAICSFDFGARYVDPGHGYFAQFDVEAAFAGNNGWRMNLDVGKTWANIYKNRVDLVASTGLGYAFRGYWSKGVQGIDNYHIKIASPIKITNVDDAKGPRVIPFILFSLGGSAQKDFKHRYGGRQVTPNFSAEFGVLGQYAF